MHDVYTKYIQYSYFSTKIRFVHSYEYSKCHNYAIAHNYLIIIQVNFILNCI